MGTPRWEHCGEMDEATVRPDRLSTFCILEHDFLLGRAMSSLNPFSTLYRETTCEHELMEPHCEHLDEDTHLDGRVVWGACEVSCPGGSREKVVIDYEAAVYGFWDGEASGPPPNDDDLRRAKQAINAALGE